MFTQHFVPILPSGLFSLPERCSVEGSLSTNALLEAFVAITAEKIVTRNQTLIRSEDDNSLLDLLKSDRNEEKSLCNLTISLFGTTTQYFKDLFSKLDKDCATVTLRKSLFNKVSDFVNDVYCGETRHMDSCKVAVEGLAFADCPEMEKKIDIETAARKSLNRDRLGSGQFCDATISTGTREFPVHKCVVSVYSQFFSKLFTTELIEKSKTVCHVSGIDDEILALVLDFIYTKEMWVADDQFLKLTPTIDYLCISSLQALDAEIESCLESLVTKENRMDMWIFAKRHHKEKLLKRAQYEFEDRSIYSVIFGPSVEEILKVDEIHIKEFLEIIKKKCAVYEYVKLIIAWVKHDVEKRKGMFRGLLDMIDIESLTESALRMLHREPALVSDNPKACKTVIDYLTPYLPNPTELVMDSGTLFAMDDSANVYKCDLPLIKQEMDDDNSFAIPLWTCIAKLERVSKRDGYSLVCRDGNLYILGGKDGDRKNVTDEVLSCDHGGNWQTEPPMNTKRFDAGAAFCRGAIYVAGGIGLDGTNLTSTECFKNGQWTLLADMQKGKSSFALVAMKDSLYAMGGCKNTTEVYSIDEECWKDANITGGMPSNVRLTATYDEKIYLVNESYSEEATVFVCDLKQSNFVREKSSITALLQRHATLALSFPGLRDLTKEIPLKYAGTIGPWKQFKDSDSDSDSDSDDGCDCNMMSDSYSYVYDSDYM